MVDRRVATFLNGWFMDDNILKQLGVYRSAVGARCLCYVITAISLRTRMDRSTQRDVRPHRSPPGGPISETFEAYRTRLLSYLGDEEPIAVQQATSSQLDRRLRDVVPEQLIRRPAPENMRQKIRELNVRKRTQIRLEDIAQKLNPILQGWLNHYGRFCPTAMDPMWRYTNATLVCVDDAQIQALCGTENTCESIDSFHCHQATQTVCTLASKQRRCVCLMGAG
jgi:Group II intron, maturase-specific domain